MLQRSKVCRIVLQCVALHRQSLLAHHPLNPFDSVCLLPFSFISMSPFLSSYTTRVCICTPLYIHPYSPHSLNSACLLLHHSSHSRPSHPRIITSIVFIEYTPIYIPANDLRMLYLYLSLSPFPSSYTTSKQIETCPLTHCNTLQHTTTHCNTLQHTATHCNTLQHTAAHFNTLRRAATHAPQALPPSPPPVVQASFKVSFDNTPYF